MKMMEDGTIVMAQPRFSQVVPCQRPAGMHPGTSRRTSASDEACEVPDG